MNTPSPLLRILLVALPLLFAGSSLPTDAAGSCGGLYCSYLPLVQYPGPLVVNNLTGVPTRNYCVISQGSILNTTDAPLINAVVEARTYDQADLLVDVITSTALLSATIPGQLNPFSFTTACDTTNRRISRITARVISSSPQAVERYLAVTVVSVRAIPVADSRDMIFEIVLRNDNDQPIRQVRGIRWYYPSFYETSVEELTPLLQPGAQITWRSLCYRFNMYDYDCGILGLNIAVQGIAVP